MMNSTKFRRWDVWYANVKFEDSDESKIRPVVIYNDSAYAIISFKMTGIDRGDTLQEYRVREWEKAGLTKQTSIRLGKVLKLEEKDMVRRIGRLSAADIMQIELRLAAHKA